MKFKELKVKNFCSFADATLPLDARGLVLILGENLDAPKADSNGSGKSLLFDALCWCLWGQTVRGIKGDSVVSRKAKKNCVVEVIFSDNGNNYRVVRHQKDKDHFKANDLEFFINEDNACSSSISGTQELVDEAVGLDFLTFRAMMPGAGIKAAEMTDKAIKELLESLLQTELLAEAQTIAKTRLKEATLKLSNLRTLFNSLVDLSGKQSDLIRTYEQNFASFSKNTEDALGMMDAEIANQEEHIQSLTQDVANATKAAAQARVLENHLELLSKQEQDIRKAINEILTQTKDKLAHQQKEANKLSVERATLTAEITRLQSLGDSCSNCGQTVDPNHVGSSISTAEVAREFIDGRIQLVTEYIEAIKTASDEAVGVHYKQLDENSTETKAVTKKLQQHKITAASATQSEAYLKRSREDLQGLIKSRKDREELKNPFQDLIQEATAILYAQEEDLNEYKCDIDEAEKLVTELEFWVEGFSPKGMRSHMLRNITPILNDRAAHYCKLLTGNEMKIRFQTERTLKNGTSSEDFNIIVEQANGSDSYAGCSGGEKARADLVISLVLGDLASFRANKKIPFRFLDEAFERVDNAGLDAVVNLLIDQRDKYETIFVITHKSELKQYFSKTITVTKENGYSKMEDNA